MKPSEMGEAKFASTIIQSKEGKDGIWSKEEN